MKKFSEWFVCRLVLEHEKYVDDDGNAHDDEGNTWHVGKRYAGAFNREVPGPRVEREPSPRVESDPARVAALEKAVAARGGDFLRSILSQVRDGRVLSDAQKKAVRQAFYRARMKDEADLFR